MKQALNYTMIGLTVLWAMCLLWLTYLQLFTVQYDAPPLVALFVRLCAAGLITLPYALLMLVLLALRRSS